MKTAVIQIEIKEGSPRERISGVSKVLNGLRDVDLVVLPELWSVGFFSIDKYINDAKEIEDDFVGMASSKSRELRCYLVSGSFLEKEGDLYYNTNLLFSPEGKELARYRKIHLFGYESKEAKYLSRGKDAVVVQTGIGNIGLATCYDLRFPELFRKMADKSVEIIVISSAWPLSRIEDWKLLNRARALENQSYLVACNCAGFDCDIEFGGHSVIIDPYGVVIRESDNGFVVLTAHIDMQRLHEIRNKFPVLKDRIMQIC